MTSCAYCDREAVAAGYTDPPLCSQHLVIVQVITRIEAWGWRVSVESVQNFIYFNGIQGVRLDDVPALCASMLEFRDEADQCDGEGPTTDGG